jgi:ribonuclease HI
VAVGLGIIARDDASRFLGACGLKKRMSVTPASAEAVAATHAMIFAKEKGFTDIIFEGVAFQIVDTVNSTSHCDCRYIWAFCGGR